jgi:thioredoxin reductase
MDIPFVDPEFQTNVPGIYIAGELGGMGLIRNAVEQGRQAVVAIARRTADRAADPATLDLLIVGAGPAGISASLAAKQAGLRTVTVEQDSLGGTVAHFPRGKLIMTAPTVLPLYGTLNFREIRKEAMLAIWTKVIADTALEISFQERVVSIRPFEGGFAVETDSGS